MPPKGRVFVPKVPLVFNEDGTMLLFEVSNPFKRMPRMSVPGYILSFASALVMMDAFATASFMKGAIFSIPFLGFLALSTQMTQKSSVVVSKIERLKENMLNK